MWQIKTTSGFNKKPCIKSNIECCKSYSIKRKGGGSDETFRFFCGHVNFPEMSGGMCIWGSKSNDHKEGD